MSGLLHASFVLSFTNFSEQRDQKLTEIVQEKCVDITLKEAYCSSLIQKRVRSSQQDQKLTKIVHENSRQKKHTNISMVKEKFIQASTEFGIVRTSIKFFLRRPIRRIIGAPLHSLPLCFSLLGLVTNSSKPSPRHFFVKIQRTSGNNYTCLSSWKL